MKIKEHQSMILAFWRNIKSLQQILKEQLNFSYEQTQV